MKVPMIGKNKKKVADYCKENNKKVVATMNGKGFVEYSYISK